MTSTATTPFDWVEVFVNLPVEGKFHYRVPDHLHGRLAPGHRVLVPFGTRRVTGFVAALTTPPPNLPKRQIKTVEARLDPDPLIPPELLALVQFAAEYYLAPVGEVLKAALPPGFTGASKLRWMLTPEGREALVGPEAISPHVRELLEQARGGLDRKAARAKLGRELESAGWIAPKDQLSTADGGGEVEMVARKMGRILAEPFLMRSKHRRALFDALSDGPCSVDALRTQLGPVAFRTAFNRLRQDGVIEVHMVAADSREAHQAIASAEALPSAPRPKLTSEQASALHSLISALEGEPHPLPFLLQGVTGSGKTEVYLGLIEAALARGQGAIVLVPEIALTPQLEARFRTRFGEQVVVLHSSVPPAQRRKRWQALRYGRALIAVGPRSTVWAPVRNLGVVVVDEEHDGSFKQHSELRYHGRDLALVRAHKAGGVCVLGSATPSLESLHLVAQARMTHLRLDRRVNDRPLPKVQLVDLAEERRALKGELRLLSRPLEDALREIKNRGEQGIIFLNRRGFNTVVQCAACDEIKTCPNCDVSLTYHRINRKLTCHYCGFEAPLELRCKKCGRREPKPLGAGTERIAALLQSAIPDLRVLRLDRDVTQKAGALDETLERFRAGEADVLVGTQMVAKGHDFPNVTLVGIVLADAALAFPDFRAAERSFQLLTQVAGRAGRAHRPGRVIVQTLQPEHYVLRAALHHDVDAFFETEIALREELRYPPFSRVGAIRCEDLNEAKARAAAESVAAEARKLPEVRVLGPSEAPIARIKNRYRWMVLVFAATPSALVQALGHLRRRVGEGRGQGADLIFDVDAQDLL